MRSRLPSLALTLMLGLVAGCTVAPGGAAQPDLRAERETRLNHIVLATRQIAIDDFEAARYPDDIRALVLGSDLTAEAFLLPGRQAPELRDEQGQAEWAQRNSEYVYLGGGLNDTIPADVIIVHEDPAQLVPGEAIGVGYADGSVALLPPVAFEKALLRHSFFREQVAAR